jgi:hypothetical protein
MWIFDLALLLFVSISLSLKNLYLGVITLVLGLMIGFQHERVRFLLGEERELISTSRKVKAAIFALLMACCLLPMISSVDFDANQFETFNLDSLLPVIVLVGVFASALVAVLATEKRKR